MCKCAYPVILTLIHHQTLKKNNNNNKMPLLANPLQCRTITFPRTSQVLYATSNHVKSLYENTGNIVQPMDALIMALDLVLGRILDSTDLYLSNI